MTKDELKDCPCTHSKQKPTPKMPKPCIDRGILNGGQPPLAEPQKTRPWKFSTWKIEGGRNDTMHCVNVGQQSVRKKLATTWHRGVAGHVQASKCGHMLHTCFPCCKALNMNAGPGGCPVCSESPRCGSSARSSCSGLAWRGPRLVCVVLTY